MDKKSILIVLLCIVTAGVSYLFYKTYNMPKEEVKTTISLTGKYYNTKVNTEYDNYSLDSLVEKYSSYASDDDKWALFNSEWHEYNLRSAGIINHALTSSESFIIYTYKESDEVDEIDEMTKYIDEYINENNIYIYKVSEEIYNELTLKQYVKEIPSIIIIQDGGIYTYTNCYDENDNKIFNNYNELKDWLNKYIEVN